ncbi:iron-containing redox enzyme family protein [Nocardioides antri]|uniref:Iron-containing redox enzyme family protein n=1 Tax=Nocardioides antri TaxID=2607659 RepID=A0A5B1M231_9ACTN|nr:iron-containing redox enzyme family protein [Nocardioides antri]KAA1425810.1 iron-containing redox enzyme family protein [Nocardioides antri]
MSSRHTLRRQLSRSADSEGKQAPPNGPMTLPTPCGTLSESVVSGLTASAGRRSFPTDSDVRAVTDPVHDRDFQLALWVLYELHHRGLAGVDDTLEWDPDLLGARRRLETVFETAVRDLVELPDPMPTTSSEVATELRRMTISGTEPELPAFLAREASHDQFLDYLAERAVYHLRESDAQCFLLPRIGGGAKTALAEILYDEFGAGRPDRLHADIFARALADLGMPTGLASYVDDADALTLASVNVTTLFNLHRRLRGAAAGHLAAFEATSSIPCRLIADGAERLALPASVVDYYVEHVEADSVHEQVAITGLCGNLVDAEPDLAADVILGAAACLTIDTLAADRLLARLREQPDRIAS